MDIQRLIKHLLMTDWQVNRVFPRKTLNAIERAIKESESTHAGEIRFVVEGALDGPRSSEGNPRAIVRLRFFRSCVYGIPNTTTGY